MNWFNLFKNNKKSPKNLAFIMGCPRGGTTWLWSVLESHDNTIPFLLNVNKQNGTYKTSESGVYIKNPKSARKILTNFANSNKKNLVFEKTPQHTLKHKLIRSDFPNSKFIVILRNPIAIVNSMLNSEMNAFKNHNIDKSLIEVKKYYSSLSELTKQKKTYYLTYENLFFNTEYELIRLFNYLDLDIKNIEGIIKENKNTTKVDVKGSLRKAEPDSYKADLTKKQLVKIQDFLKKEINKFNQINLENISS